MLFSSLREVQFYYGDFQEADSDVVCGLGTISSLGFVVDSGVLVASTASTISVSQGDFELLPLHQAQF